MTQSSTERSDECPNCGRSDNMKTVGYPPLIFSCHHCYWTMLASGRVIEPGAKGKDQMSEISNDGSGDASGYESGGGRGDGSGFHGGWDTGCGLGGSDGASAETGFGFGSGYGDGLGGSSGCG